MPELRKLNDNFYLLIRKKKLWSKEEKKLINKYINYNLFSPIPVSYSKLALFGYECKYNFYEKDPPKYIMFNFDYDTKNNKKQSLRGACAVSIKGIKKRKNKTEHYFTIDLIGNKSISNQIVKSQKKRKGISVKTGKDMLEWWKTFGKYSCFDYCKLYAMEDVLGFYWKFGWRFGENFNYFKNKENQIQNQIKQLNLINFTYKKYSYMYNLLYERDKVLRKYFDKYLDDYYSDSELVKYKLNDDDYESYKINNTLHMQRFRMRFNGYPMYLNCC